ncbi:MAG TPA: hypothetical protein VFZ63_17340 [Jiangellaceae bacterium]
MKRRLGTALAAVVLAATACSGNDEGEATHPLLEDPTPTATSTAPGTPGMASPTEAGFPQECGQLISFVDIAEIVATPIAGMRRVYQDEFPAESGRLERLTCSYGTEPPDDESPSGGGDDPDAESGPYITIAVSSYTDPGAAAARVEATIDSARIGGQQIEALEIGGRSGFFLRDDDTVSFVFADEELTYVVTLLRAIVPEPAEQVVLVTMVEQLIRSSGGA